MTTTNESSTATAIFRLTHDDGCWLQAELPSDMDSRERLALAQEEFGTTIVACDPLPANHPASVRHAERAARAPADGGPAFPLGDSGFDMRGTTHEGANGMTLRDYFAAKAMHSALVTAETGNKVTHQELYKIVASLSYQMADTMLKARG